MKNETLELILRPKTWSDYIGQENVKANLRLIIDAAKGRRESCDHLLFYGQAGLGKTTLAHIVAREMNALIKTTSGPALEKTGDIAAILTNLEPHEVLFIDEVHRISKPVEEVLYPALESRKLHIIVGRGPSARTLSIDLPPFTVIGATTRTSLLSAPLRSRFGATFRLKYYNLNDIERIITRSAKLIGVEVAPRAVKRLARASRFTPRVANRLLKRCRDWVQVHKKKKIDEDVVRQTLELLEIDDLGLEETDRHLLSTIIKRFGGGPVGVRSLAAAVNEDPGTVEEVFEPYLIRLGLLERTKSGRVATPTAHKHLQFKNIPPSLLE